MKKLREWVPVLGVLLFAVSSHGDEIGAGSCGKPIIIRGAIQHAKTKPGIVVAGAKHPEMYVEEVYGKDFTALIEGLPEDLYTIRIYLAETWFKEPGKRKMTITSGDQMIADNLDLVESAGVATQMVVEAEIYHEIDNIKGPLSVRFQGTQEYAKLNGMVVATSDGVPVACVKARNLEPYYSGFGMEIPEVNDPVVYTDASVPVAQRVDDLVRRMSLVEKVNQMQNAAPAIKRLGVPAYDYWNECLHGVARAGEATVFPQAIGMAAMWDETMMQAIADTIATEGRAKNNGAREKQPNTARYYGLTFWTPNINIFRDPRWGRGHETYGEDPYLTGKLGVAFIKGIQGDDPKYYKALACAKHFAVHSGPEKLRHHFDAAPPERDLYETYLPQFEMAVKEGGVANVMSVYNAIYGIPGPASAFLLTDILRDRWGFDGHVVSDCGAVRDVWKNHKYVETREEAAAVSVKAGNDLNCGRTYVALVSAVEKGLITEAEIDVSLKRILEARFRLGLFDSPADCAYLKVPASENNTPAHGQLALQAARESMVLLKNDGVLPLDKSALKRVAVIGPNANSTWVLQANYSGTPSNPVTVLEGIKNELGGAVEVLHVGGCPLALREGETYSVSSNALAIARQADAVIFVGGLDASFEGEEMKTTWVGSAGGDRTAIELPSPQHDLLQALYETGKPVIFVNLSGSSIGMPWEAEHLPAILQAWYPGQNGGTAVADVLFGKYNPAGRLPVTFYRSTSDLPAFTDYSMENRTYRYFAGNPLYPFGHGLSYTKFTYGRLQTSSSVLSKNGNAIIRLGLTNSGQVDGDEVVQLYVKHLQAPVPQPIKSLAAFKRVRLKAGETKTVELTLPATALRYWAVDKEQYVIPSGEFEVQVGPSSADIRQVIHLNLK